MSSKQKNISGLALFEKQIGRIAEPMRPFIAFIARFLLVSTFLEDSLRLYVQWDDQMGYLVGSRGYSQILAMAFLGINIILMIVCSLLAIIRKRTAMACSGLAFVIIGQITMYGLFTNVSLVIRSLSLIGAILLLFVDGMTERGKKTFFAGLPMLSEKNKTRYVAFFGRVLLIALFASFAMNGERTVARMIVSGVSFVTCTMVVIGFKAKFSAIFLTALLSVSNMLMNNWWSLHELHPSRDFIKYDFFQTLSIIGGLLLLAESGPGGISIDEKKKEF